jgi:hypothetical protein
LAHTTLAGFPYFFDINLSADEAQKWIDVMNFGLMIDDVKTQKVTAQLVVYNAELGYFGNVMVFFEFSEGGKVSVTHSLNTIKVELYDTAADMSRLAMEVILCLGVAWSVYEELMDVFDTKKATGSYAAYFASVWNYVDVASITLHVVTIIMWFSYGFGLAANFAPDIHYDIYKNLEGTFFYLVNSCSPFNACFVYILTVFSIDPARDSSQSRYEQRAQYIRPNVAQTKD